MRAGAIIGMVPDGAKDNARPPAPSPLLHELRQGARTLDGRLGRLHVGELDVVVALEHHHEFHGVE